MAVYVGVLAPAMYWLDSSELAAAAWSLGVAHPPGHPLAALIGKFCALVPLGSIAFKVGLASALCGAGAAAQTARLGEHVARRTGAGAHAATLLGAAAGVLFGFSYAAAFQGVRPEVYALNALLVVSAALELAKFDEGGDRRRLYLGALFCGLALANHHLLALALIAPAIPFLIFRRAKPDGASGATAATVARVLAAGALALALYAYLPLRALRHPLVDWGAPSTWSRFFWTVSAQAFQKSLARAQTTEASGVGWALVGELGFVGALLALGGAYVLFRLRGRRRLAFLLVAAAAADAAAPGLVGFDRANPDAFGYLETAVALAAALACALPAAIAHALARRNFSRETKTGTAVSAALLLAALALGIARVPQFALARAYDAENVLGKFLDAAPARGVLVTSYFQTIFGAWYLRVAEGRRPDVALVHRHFLDYPGYREDVSRETPEFAPLLGAHDVDANLLAARPDALVEYDLDLPDALAVRSHAVDASAASGEAQSARFAAWQSFLAAHRACRVNDDPARAIAAARARVGADPELDALESGCAKLRSPSRN